MSYIKRISLLFTAVIVAFTGALMAAPEGTDSGYVVIGPPTIEGVVALKNGQTVEAIHQSGVVVSENRESPWYHATFFIQGSRVKDAGGGILGDVLLCETTDPDGDSTWMVVNWWYDEGPGEYFFITGTGKWTGITGDGTMSASGEKRADEYTTPNWKMSWKVDPSIDARLDVFGDPDKYPYHDKGYSFHGPHTVEEVKKLSNGLVLSHNHQAGVIISENEDSPRHWATGLDHGTTIKNADGSALADAVLIRNIDADGNICWFAHWWWYAKGDGSYRFVDGTGKWKGIQGSGRTLGMLREREDDHFMLNWEFRWTSDR